MGERPLNAPTNRANRAVFLDRDGVLNRPVYRNGKSYPPESLKDFELLPRVAEACQKLKSKGFLLIVVTNQPDVGRGTQRLETVESMHLWLLQQLPLDAIEVCYDEHDSLRYKPAPGMLHAAAERLQIDLSKSFLVGDRWRDVDCGKNAGCTTFHVDHRTGEPLRSPADFTVGSLWEAATLITQPPSQSP